MLARSIDPHFAHTQLSLSALFPPLSPAATKATSIATSTAAPPELSASERESLSAGSGNPLAPLVGWLDHIGCGSRNGGERRGRRKLCAFRRGSAQTRTSSPKRPKHSIRFRANMRLKAANGKRRQSQSYPALILIVLLAFSSDYTTGGFADPPETPTETSPANVPQSDNTRATIRQTLAKPGADDSAPLRGRQLHDDASKSHQTDEDVVISASEILADSNRQTTYPQTEGSTNIFVGTTALSIAQSTHLDGLANPTNNLGDFLTNSTNITATAADDGSASNAPRDSDKPAEINLPRPIYRLLSVVLFGLVSLSLGALYMLINRWTGVTVV